MQLGRIGTGAQINVLTDVVFNYSESTSVCICGVSALRQMGETSTVLGIYESWARDTDPDLRRAAGPSSWTFAIWWSSRSANSVRLLAEATKDEDANVRGRAKALLKSRGR